MIATPAPDILAEHLHRVQTRYDQALAACDFDAVIIGAGVAELRFQDDQHAPFRSNPQLQQWLPLPAHPGACLLYRPGQQPVAVLLAPDSYWEEPPAPPGEPWAALVDIRVVDSLAAVAPALGERAGRIALLGPEPHWDALRLRGERNPAALVHHLHYDRAWKTPYEVDCLRVATTHGVAGHRAAAQAFTGGGSEFDCLLAFLQGGQQTADELPYPPIVGAGRHAAVLHYQHYRHAVRPAGSLLIDAGCQVQGYASDITRTHVLDEGSDFAALRDDLDTCQLRLCARVQPGVPFAELHHAAHVEIAGLLVRHGLVNSSAEAALEQGLTHCFFPHGLGHLLGLQVHDVGGWQAGPAGGELEAPASYPRLRLLRTLEPGFSLTMEPGLYFIDSLLAEAKASAKGKHINWDRVASLREFGGIRIEDNVVVTRTGHQNLTREAFAAAAH